MGHINRVTHSIAAREVIPQGAPGGHSVSSPGELSRTQGRKPVLRPRGQMMQGDAGTFVPYVRGMCQPAGAQLGSNSGQPWPRHLGGCVNTPSQAPPRLAGPGQVIPQLTGPHSFFSSQPSHRYAVLPVGWASPHPDVPGAGALPSGSPWCLE